MVHLIELNVIGLKALQRAFQMAADNIGGETALIIRTVQLVVHGTVYLGRQHNLLAASAAQLEPAADDCLCKSGIFTPAVNIGGIKKLTPASSAASIIRNASFSSVIGPKFIVPRQSRLTFNPDFPSFVYCISRSLLL